MATNRQGKRQHYHVTYVDAALMEHTYRTFDPQIAAAKLVAFEPLAPLQFEDNTRRICYSTACADVRHEKAMETEEVRRSWWLAEQKRIERGPHRRYR